MNIWVIQTGERLPLEPGTRMMRTGLLAQELAGRKHDVTWWASAFCHYTRKWVDDRGAVRALSDNLSLHLLRGSGYRKNVSLKRFFDHALVARRFTQAAEKAQRPDVIIAALPDYRIAYAAYKYARRHNVPFILDLRDRWPWDFLHELPRFVQPLARLALANDFRMAKRLIARSDSLVTMMRSWDGWIRAMGRQKRPTDAVFYLGAGALKPDDTKIREGTTMALRACEGRWPVLFIGAFNNRFWPKIAVDAANLFKQYTAQGGARPIFILAGDGDFMPELRKISADNPDIVLPGYVNDAEIAALLACAKVGLVTGNGDFEAMPNKVFTYLSGGVPILSSLDGELRAFLDTEQVGMTCRNGAEMYAAIKTLLDDEPRRADMASRAATIFNERYEAGRLYGQYADMVERMAAGAGG